MKRQCLNTGSCPHCGSGRIKAVSTTRPRRYFKCRICKKSWRCLEVIDSKPFWLSDVLTELLSEGQLSEYDFKTRKAITAICSANYKPDFTDM